MNVFVDDDKCGGHGVCCALCPDVFELSDDGYAVVLTTAVPVEHEDAVRAAVNQCPTLAISITT
jgi:ferredoxin